MMWMAIDAIVIGPIASDDWRPRIQDFSIILPTMAGKLAGQAWRAALDEKGMLILTNHVKSVWSSSSPLRILVDINLDRSGPIS